MKLFALMTAPIGNSAALITDRMSAASGAGIAVHKNGTNVIALRKGAPGLSDAVPQPASRTLADR